MTSEHSHRPIALNDLPSLIRLLNWHNRIDWKELEHQLETLMNTVNVTPPGGDIHDDLSGLENLVSALLSIHDTYK